MRRILHVILGLCTISLAISTYATVQYVPLGNKVTIPCEGYGDHSTARWLHRKDDNEFETIVHEHSGYTFQSKPLSTRKRTIRNFSLEISPFTELDKGTYVCQVCKSRERCIRGKEITLLHQSDTVSTAYRTQFIIEGDQFSCSCLYNYTLNITNITLKPDWRFEALGENTAISVYNKLTKKNVLFIPDVQPTNAGRYSYWGETSTGQQWSICSVTLCVLSVRAVKLNDSPQNCTLYCDVDMDTDKGGSAVVRTDKWNISITGTFNKPKSSLRCRLLSGGVDTHTFSMEDATVTAQSRAFLSITAENLYRSRPSVTALISVSAALLFIAIIALFVFLCVLQQKADRNSTRRTNGHSEGGNESQVIYSTPQIPRYQQQNVIASDTECVYSLIKV